MFVIEYMKIIKIKKQVTFCPSAFLSNQTQYATTLKYFQAHQQQKKFYFYFSIKSAGKFVSVSMWYLCVDIRKSKTHTPPYYEIVN